MKKSAIITLILITILFCGCIGEDAYCPSPVTANMELVFTYTGDAGDPGMFSKSIDNVTLFAFDDNGVREFARTYEKNELKEHQGAKIRLEPGSYTIVCWGNTLENTDISACEDLATGRIHNPNFPTGGTIASEDHLYYGTTHITVPKDGVARDEITFEGAHINMKVYIRYQPADIFPGQWPTVKGHNFMPQYDMYMEPAQNYHQSYYPETLYNSESDLGECLFQVYRFGDDNQVVIDIEDYKGENIVTIDLCAYMRDNGISVDGKNEATVQVMVEISLLGVTISVPEWGMEPIDPEI